jgi:putative tributyrin esterase
MTSTRGTPSAGRRWLGDAARRAAAVLAAVAVVVPAGASAPALRDGFAPPATRPSPADSGRVVTDSLWSQALGIRKHVVVWLPPSYARSPARRYPVAYYLHGVSGAETDWVRLGHLDATLDSLVAAGVPEMIVVMPDGDDGWWTTWNWLGDYTACRRDRPARAEPAATWCVPWPHYDDYVARDLVAWVDGHFRTLADRAHRGIAGLSMGGYGAMALALAYPDVFSAAASHSGVVSPLQQGQGTDGDLRYPPAIDSLRHAYGPRLWPLMEQAFGKDTVAWYARDPLRLAERLLARDRAAMPALFIDCGRDDALIGQSRAFDRGLRALGIPHEYAEWPGAHTWEYWRRHGAESAAWMARRIGQGGTARGARR